MKNNFTFHSKRSLIAFLMVMAIAVTGLAQSGATQFIRWAGEANPSASLRSNILHAPDNAFTALDPPVSVGGFGSAMRYQRLNRLLGVSRAVLARADVVMFEGNGGAGAGPFNGWESGIFTFSDGAHSRTVNYNELIGPSSDPTVIATGTIENAAYRDFFGLCTPNPSKISYILFDLHSTGPVINTEDQLFQINLANGFRPDGSFGEGSPDPDAIGIFSSCSME